MKTRKLTTFLSTFLVLAILFTIEPVSVFVLVKEVEAEQSGYVLNPADEYLLASDTTDVRGPETDKNTGEELFRFNCADAQKLMDQAKTDEKAGKEVLIKMKAGVLSGTKKVVIQLENALLKKLSDETNARLRIDTGLAAIELSNSALDSLYSAAKGKDIGVNVEQKIDSDLPAEIKDIVGDRPVYDISIAAGDIKISDFGGALRLSVHYTLNKGEDPDAIVLYYLNKNSNAVQVMGRYNQLTQSVEFNTTRLSGYAVGYRYIGFSDIKSNPDKDDIEFAAAREILCGIGNGKFGPDKALTRGMLLAVLVKLANVEPARAAGFDDVSPEKYYSQYIGWAAANGLVTGVGNNRFRPDKAVTREELAAILNKFIKYLNLNYRAEDTKIKLRDIESISFWAKDAAKNMLTMGIMQTDPENSFSPDKIVTRAEFAAILRKIIDFRLESN